MAESISGPYVDTIRETQKSKRFIVCPRCRGTGKNYLKTCLICHGRTSVEDEDIPWYEGYDRQLADSGHRIINVSSSCRGPEVLCSHEDDPRHGHRVKDGILTVFVTNSWKVT